MKFMGMHREGCQCHYCIGKNPRSSVKRKIRKGQKSRDRQESKKQIASEMSSKNDDSAT